MGDPSEVYKTVCLAHLWDIERKKEVKETQGGGERFVFGCPLEDLSRVRVVGIVVGRNQDTGKVVIDDSTSTMEAKMPPSQKLENMGCLLDVLASLRTDKSGRRYLDVHAFNQKRDAQEEIVGLLSLVSNYSVYFDPDKHSKYLNLPDSQTRKVVPHPVNINRGISRGSPHHKSGMQPTRTFDMRKEIKQSLDLSKPLRKSTLLGHSRSVQTQKSHTPKLKRQKTDNMIRDALAPRDVNVLSTNPAKSRIRLCSGKEHLGSEGVSLDSEDAVDSEGVSLDSEAAVDSESIVKKIAEMGGASLLDIVKAFPNVPKKTIKQEVESLLLECEVYINEEKYFAL
ncbi:hypothetical protein AAMO2058_000609400 [Amorphochlora amoebiformis]